jgi:uncharacterized FAD-dependent dehydrogenase
MPVQVQISLSPEAAADEKAIRKISGTLAKLDPSDISRIRVIRRSVDARHKNIKINLTVEVFSHNEIAVPLINPFIPRDVSKEKEVIIVGAGPAGLFAALRLIELGIRPFIIE